MPTNENPGVLAVWDALVKCANSGPALPPHESIIAQARADLTELLETLIYVRDNAASDSPEMWQRVDEIIAKATGADCKSGET